MFNPATKARSGRDQMLIKGYIYQVTQNKSFLGHFRGGDFRVKAYKIKIWRVELEDACVMRSEEEARNRAYKLMKPAHIDEQDGVNVAVKEVSECEDCGNDVGSENLEVYDDMLLCPNCKDEAKEQE